MNELREALVQIAGNKEFNCNISETIAYKIILTEIATRPHKIYLLVELMTNHVKGFPTYTHCLKETLKCYNEIKSDKKLKLSDKELNYIHVTMNKNIDKMGWIR